MMDENNTLWEGHKNSLAWLDSAVHRNMNLISLINVCQTASKKLLDGFFMAVHKALNLTCHAFPVIFLLRDFHGEKFCNFSHLIFFYPSQHESSSAAVSQWQKISLGIEKCWISTKEGKKKKKIDLKAIFA